MYYVRIIASAGTAFLALVGALVTLRELALSLNWIEETTKLTWVSPTIGLPFLVGLTLVWGLFRNRRKTRASCIVPNREAAVEVEISDLFRRRAAYVIPVSTCIDCDMDSGLILGDSVLGSAILRFFERDWRGFKDKVQTALSKRPDIASEANGELGEPSYPIGTVLRLDHDRKLLWFKRRMIFFLICSSRIVNGQARSEVDEVLNAAAALFTFLKERGGHIGPLRMPVLGTGYGRLTFRVDEVARELALLFLASCSDRRYIERLTIAIHPARDKKFPVDMSMMESFLKEHCTFRRIPMEAREGEERPSARQVE